MPFGLKNACVAYETLMGAVFSKHIGYNHEVYIDGIILETSYEDSRCILGRYPDVTQKLQHVLKSLQVVIWRVNIQIPWFHVNQYRHRGKPREVSNYQ